MLGLGLKSGNLKLLPYQQNKWNRAKGQLLGTQRDQYMTNGTLLCIFRSTKAVQNPYTPRIRTRTHHPHLLLLLRLLLPPPHFSVVSPCLSSVSSLFCFLPFSLIPTTHLQFLTSVIEIFASKAAFSQRLHGMMYEAHKTPKTHKTHAPFHGGGRGGHHHRSSSSLVCTNGFLSSRPHSRSSKPKTTKHESSRDLYCAMKTHGF